MASIGLAALHGVFIDFCCHGWNWRAGFREERRGDIPPVPSLALCFRLWNCVEDQTKDYQRMLYVVRYEVEYSSTVE